MARSERAFEARLSTIRERALEPDTVGKVAAVSDAYRASRERMREQEAGTSKTWAAELAGVASHPSITRRVRRLELLGGPAQPKLLSKWRSPSHKPGMLAAIVQVPLAAVFFLLIAFCAVAFAGVMGVIFLFGASAAALFMGMVMAGVHALLL